MIDKRNFFVQKRREDINAFLSFLKTQFSKGEKDINYNIARYSVRSGFTKSTLRKWYSVLVEGEFIIEKDKDRIDGFK